MRKIGIILGALVLAWAVIGCGTTSMDTNNRIVAPQNNLAPMDGSWVVESCVTEDVNDEVDKSEDWVGKTIKFAPDAIQMGEIVSENIRYKVKRVKSEEYLLHKFKGSIDKLGLNEKEAQVITVSSDDKYLYEFIKISDDMVIANIDNEFFSLKKTEDKGNMVFRENISRSGSEVVRLEESREPMKSGVLLGIRTPEKTNKKTATGAYSYRTMWIANDGDTIHPVMEAKDLFLPRKNGFWNLMVREWQQGGGKEDTLLAYRLYRDNAEKKDAGEDTEDEKSFWLQRDGVIRKAILYAGNDYVVVENVGSGVYKDSQGTWQHNKLQVLPVDSLSNTEGVKISDIAGENGTMALERALSSFFETYDATYLKGIAKDMDDVSFGLYRKTGHWFLKGRIGLEQKEVPYIDFNINLIPPNDFVAYDILQVPWTQIKDRVPNASDAFTSPNGDIALILTKDHILIYKIVGEKLSESPLRKVALEKGDAVVMAEWATGYYVDKWESIFIKNNETKEVP